MSYVSLLHCCAGVSTHLNSADVVSEDAPWLSFSLQSSAFSSSTDGFELHVNGCTRCNVGDCLTLISVKWPVRSSCLAFLTLDRSVTGFCLARKRTRRTTLISNHSSHHTKSQFIMICPICHHDTLWRTTPSSSSAERVTDLPQATPLTPVEGSKLLLPQRGGLIQRLLLASNVSLQVPRLSAEFRACSGFVLDLICEIHVELLFTCNYKRHLTVVSIKSALQFLVYLLVSGCF